ncbi:phosphonate ABC transporter ATP-binding protein [Nitrospina gracilis]|uniref:phosphonate ABC transporter ATP-binding protein n=1 Tax=Nitrospina gracilis TaxID=35801 RepID=UPI001F02D49A|nr:phosphonate ABC transporter ATP-binding protein [Nitrospina gracilis]MCF8721387.1 phosphonate transport system ATP-binding protein [Nitrospina gracilis Nb-211]
MLILDRVSKTYGDGTEAVKEVSFELKPGEFAVVLGQSGAGKSTLLRCINRLVEPTTGRIALDGEDITGAPPQRLRALRCQIGMIFQNYNLVARNSVLTNVLAGRLGYTPSSFALINHFSSGDVDEAHATLRRLGIADKAHSRADSLSGGQQQRVGIARALMQHPKLILADEPVASLDPVSAESILEILKDINQKDGVTVLCNLHVPELARRFGRRILGMKTGKLVFDASSEVLDPAQIDALYDLPVSP